MARSHLFSGLRRPLVWSLAGLLVLAACTLGRWQPDWSQMQASRPHSALPSPARAVAAPSARAIRRGQGMVPLCPVYIHITQAPTSERLDGIASVSVEFGEDQESLCISSGLPDSSTFRFSVEAVDRTSAFALSATGASATAVPLATDTVPRVNRLVAAIDGITATGQPTVVADTAFVTASPGVRVIPTTPSVTVEEQQEGDAVFVVHNGRTVSATYSLSCSAFVMISCGGLNTYPTITLAANARQTVTAHFGNYGSTGTGSIRLTASGQSTSFGTATVNVVNAGRLKVFAPANDQVDRTVCPTVGAGANSAVQCGDLLYAHTFPGYQSMSKPRALTMLYVSGTARPDPLVAVEYNVLNNDPTYARLAVDIQDSVTGTLLRRAYFTPPVNGTRRTVRMVVALADTLVRKTGAPVLLASVRSALADGTPGAVIATKSARLLTVNRSASRFGAGWWPAGIDRLHVLADSTGILLEQPDGSSLFYRRQGSTFVAPVGEYSTLQRLSDGRYRRVAEGKRVTATYLSAGFLTRVEDNSETPNHADFTWAADTLKSMQDAGGATTTFTYVGDTVTISYPGVPAVRLVRNAAGDLASIRDADNLQTPFTYQTTTHRMLTSQARGTGAFRYTWDALGLVDSVHAPSTATAYSPSLPPRIFEAWQRSGAAAIGAATPSAPATVGEGAPTVTVTQRRVVDGQSVADVSSFTVHRTGAILTAALPSGTTSIERDSVGHALQVVLPTGGRVWQEYGTDGLLQRTIAEVMPGSVGRDTLPRYDTTRYEWHPTRRSVTKIVNPERDSSRITYDSRGRRDSVVDALSRATTFEYTARGQVRYIRAPHPTDAAAREPKPAFFVYDSVTGNLLRSGKGNDSVRYEYRSTNPYEAWRSVNSLNEATEVELDAQKRVLSQTQTGAGIGRKTRYTYDDTARVRAVIDPMGGRATWFSDAAGRVTKACIRDLWCETTEYGDGVNPTLRRDRRNVEQVTTFDGAGRPTRVRIGFSNTFYGSEQRDFEYSRGLLTRALNEVSDVVRTYDPFGRLVGETQRIRMNLPDTSQWQAVNVFHAYDRNGRRRATYIDGLGGQERVCNPRVVDDGEYNACAQPYRFIPSDSIRYVYDQAGNLDTLVNTMWQAQAGVGPNRWVYEQDRKDRVTTLRVPLANGSTKDIGYAYDDNDRLVASRNIPAVGLDSLIMNDVGRAYQRSYGGQTTSYDFDGLGQIKQELDMPGSVVNTFTYDSLGNRLTDRLYQYTYNDRGQLVNRQSLVSSPCQRAYEYDLNGNQLMERPEPTGCGELSRRDMHYNAANLMDSMTVRDQQGSPISRAFRYDALGRRIYMRSNDETNLDTQSGTWRYYWADDHVLAQTYSPYSSDHWNEVAAVRLRRTNGALAPVGQWFWYGPGVDNPLATTNRQNSSQSQLLLFQDARGSTVTATNTAGTPTGSTGSRYVAFGMGSSNVGTGQPGFNSAPSAGGLVYMRNRWYDPGTGRFTQQDPIGFAGGVNLYGYAGNDPVSYSDPYRLMDCPAGGTWECIKEFGKNVLAGMASVSTPEGGADTGPGFKTGQFLGLASMAAGARAPELMPTGGGGTLAVMSGMLREAAAGKGNFGIGQATAAGARELGEAWVGRGAREFGGGKGLVSADGARVFRYPVTKAGGEVQANLETMARMPGGKIKTISNAHIDIIDIY